MVERESQIVSKKAPWWKEAQIIKRFRESQVAGLERDADMC
jgi:hypothetical protein